jgi:hypothetical protein
VPSGNGDVVRIVSGPGPGGAEAGAGALLTSPQPVNPKVAAIKSMTTEQVLPIVLRAQIMRVLVQVCGPIKECVVLLLREPCCGGMCSNGRFYGVPVGGKGRSMVRCSHPNRPNLLLPDISEQVGP